VFIHHLEPQLKRCHFEPQLKECHVFNPYLVPQVKGYVLSHNSRNTSKPVFEISSKPCRPCISKSCKTTSVVATSLGVALSRQAQHTSRSPIGETRTVRRQASVHPLFVGIARWDTPHRQVPLVTGLF